ncbi:MAG TPA: hypothetical protein ENF97_00380 [Candidatus Omnitrophica bacterium]|nr:hypothetical protein [Candidatus Omnitrophota bacterium]
MKPIILALLCSILWHVIFFFWLPVGLVSLPGLNTKSPQMTFVGKVVESRRSPLGFPRSRVNLSVWEKIFQPLEPPLGFLKNERPPLCLIPLWQHVLPGVRKVNVEVNSTPGFVLISQHPRDLSSWKISVSPLYVHPLKVERKELVADLDADFKNWLRIKKVKIYAPEEITAEF